MSGIIDASLSSETMSLASKIADEVEKHDIVTGIRACFFVACNATYEPRGEQRRHLDLEELTELLRQVIATRDAILERKASRS